ncbi:Peroxide stress-activated histidine kinase mak2 [Seminavis robusta]|uniref:histidine kinase n=1 Tax=Seminavis robusta TaxID=568900 RepID=A0A9N8EVS5_9STRA|nr:Peroxide stress-activated histidine kinase mak2 [Seminavis robusta]|eukprot:Sro1908_g304730.1 Peroxide stress-activated histidine kinase mak2 (732) ;mRNA; f:5890-8180
MSVAITESTNRGMGHVEQVDRDEKSNHSLDCEDTTPTKDLRQKITELQASLEESKEALLLKSKTLDSVLDQVSDQVVVADCDTCVVVEGKNRGQHVWEIPPFSSSSMDFWKPLLQKDRGEEASNLEQDEWNISLKHIPGKSRHVILRAHRTDNNSDIIEAALKESEERHRNLFESMVQGVVYQAQGGNIIAANPSAERILGLTLDQMKGRTSIDPRWKSIHEDGSDYPGQTHPSMVALSTGKPVTGAAMGVFHPVDEQIHWIVVDAIPRWRANETKPYQVYATFTDISDRKRYEVEILKAKEKAEEGNHLKSAFLGNMSHEIRTPLNGLMGHIELALSSQLSEDSRQENLEGLQIAIQSGRLLINIIEDILDLSKIEAGQMDVSKDQAFPLRPIMEQVNSVGNMLITQRKKTISLRTKVDPDIANCIYGDYFRIQQVLNNLASNAIKFTDTGFVEIRVGFADDNTLLVEVQDTGKGISEAHASVVFEPFRQVDFGDTRKHGGTGLGLTISKKLVQLMDGSLSVKSKLKEGSTFSFTLPYRVAPERSELQMEGPLGSAGGLGSRPNSRNNLLALAEAAGVASDGRANCSKSNNSQRKQRTVLIAEDDPVSRKIANRMLAKAGYYVILAEDGLEAVEAFEKTTDGIDLILMDIQMTHMGGLEATQRIRSMAKDTPYASEIPIIALSAGAMKGDKENGLAAGMTDYLTKPVNYKQLLATLRQYIGERGADKSNG